MVFYLESTSFPDIPLLGGVCCRSHWPLGIPRSWIVFSTDGSWVASRGALYEGCLMKEGLVDTMTDNTGAPVQMPFM